MSLLRSSRTLWRPALAALPRASMAQRHMSESHDPKAIDSDAPSESPKYTHDQMTSSYSPTAISPDEHIHDGVVPAGIVSGAPSDLQGRMVRIYKPCKNAMQSSHWNGRAWRMDWDILQKGHRWENPLMGWQSSADYMQGTHLSFRTKEEAVNFAEKQGYEWYISEPKTREFMPKAYANNFTWSGKKLKNIHTK